MTPFYKVSKIIPLVTFLSLNAFVANAQNRGKIHFGAALTGAAKFQLVPEKAARYSLWGAAGLSVVTAIDGSGNLAFFQSTGIFYDFSQYRIKGKYAWFGIKKYNLNFNPGINFSTRWEKLKIFLGPGVDWTIHSVLLLENDRSHNEDALNANAVIDQYQRKLIPFIALGISYRVTDRCSLQMKIKQNMLNSFPSNTNVTIGKNGFMRNVIQVNNQPAYLDFSLIYLFK